MNAYRVYDRPVIGWGGRERRGVFFPIYTSDLDSQIRLGVGYPTTRRIIVTRTVSSRKFNYVPRSPAKSLRVRKLSKSPWTYTSNDRNNIIKKKKPILLRVRAAVIIFSADHITPPRPPPSPLRTAGKRISRLSDVYLFSLFFFFVFHTVKLAQDAVFSAGTPTAVSCTGPRKKTPVRDARVFSNRVGSKTLINKLCDGNNKNYNRNFTLFVIANERFFS